MSNPHNIIFGTDGWRALLHQGINRQTVALVAQAFADYCKLQKISTVVIGFDGRLHSDQFAELFAGVLHANEMDVLLSHCIVPTPVVSFHCLRLRAAGVMITASHNPPQYNGIKFKSSAGSPFYTEETAKVEALIGQNTVKMAETPPRSDLLSPYLEYLERQFDFNTIKHSGLIPAIDSMHGAGARLLEEILGKHDIPAKTIAGAPLTDFGGRLAEPIASNLKPLSEFIHAGSFGIGLATDGDADRLGVMDDKGQYVNIQEVILALADYVKNYRKLDGPLVKTASVTDKMLRLATENQVIDVQVGFKYVAEAMMEHRAAFGAEESGGFGFGHHLPERDGIFSALMMLEMLAVQGHTKLSSLLDMQRNRLDRICYDRIDWHNHDERRHGVLSLLVKNPPQAIAGFSAKQQQHYSSSRGIINGIKIRLEGRERWLLLRVSETEPMVRIYAEGQSDDEVKILLAAGKSLFENMQQNKQNII